MPDPFPDAPPEPNRLHLADPRMRPWLPLTFVPGLDRINPPSRPWVFAVEDRSLQLVWRALGPGPVEVRAADTVVHVETDGGPGSVVLDDLPPRTTLEVTLRGDGAVVTSPDGHTRPIPAHWRRLRATTLASPPGAELFRFATISDLHIGATRFGYRGTMIERPVPEVAHPIRAAAAAIDDLDAWGAQLLLVKGDLTDNGRAKDWDSVGRLLADCPIPVDMLPGNHDRYGAEGEPDPYDALEHLGHDMTRHVKHLDVPGLRLILADSTSFGHRTGRIRYLEDPILALLTSSSTPAFITLHHYAQRFPFPTFHPPGISSTEANPFIRQVAAVKPTTMISSGHTHRHRRRQVGPIVLTEVGSPKDYPGTWAGYVVHEGGIRQVVRRVSRPDILRWTDYSAAAALHAWGVWSPGWLSHRCFTHAWPAA